MQVKFGCTYLAMIECPDDATIDYTSRRVCTDEQCLDRAWTDLRLYTYTYQYLVLY